MVDPSEFRVKLQALIEKFHVLKMERGENGLKDLSEANVRKDFINPLFEALDWKTDDSHEYDAEKYVRGAGFADVALKLNGKPAVFIEAKRFGEVPARADRSVQTTLTGYRIYADWTAEERQVLNYAGMSLDVKWAILTNFEKFRLFNAKTGITILDIEKPEEYLDRIDELILLSKRNTESHAIDKLESRVERKDVDLAFLNAMNHWRVMLAKEIYKEFPDMPLETLKKVVQRILDRLVVIRYAEDKWVLNDPDQLKAVYEYWQRTRTYTKLHESLRSLFAGFDSIHDSRIFEKDELVDAALEKVSPTLLGDIINELYNQSFRKFTSDILGATYESYLGHELVAKNGRLELQPNEQVRKSGGIYYTPHDIVSFIVDKTVGIALENIWNDVVNMFDDGRYIEGTQRFQEIFDLKILDLSCGSGSFLIETFDAFKSYCEKYNALIEEADRQIGEKINELRRNGENEEAWRLEAERPLKLENYETRTLYSSVYGVDIDPAAAEIGAVNLVLQALKRGERLPLILNENIKIGNSLVSGDREELKKYFTNVDSKRPFDWSDEFHAVMAARRFSCVIGNPPYVNMESMPEEQVFFQMAYPEIFSGKNDLLYYFMFRGLDLLEQGGRLGFIVSRYFTDALFASKLRKYLLENSAIETIIDFGNFQVFGNVNVLTLVVILRKESDNSIRDKNNLKIVRVKKWEQSISGLLERIRSQFTSKSYDDDAMEIFELPQSQLTEKPWSLANPTFSSILQKMQTNSTPLGALCDTEQSQKTGLNEVFIVDSQTVAKWHLEKGILRRVITNSEVRKYYINWTDGFLIYTNDSTDLDKFPNTKRYLQQFRKQLEARSECKDGLYPWWRLQRPRRESIFSAPEKIIVPFMSTENRFGYDDREDGKGYYGTTDTYMVVPFGTCTLDIKFLLAVLNSKCLEFYHKNTAKLKRDEYYEYRESLKRLPIPNIDTRSELYKQIVSQVVSLIGLKKMYYGSIHDFENILRNFADSRTAQETLYENFRRADVVDLGRSKKLIDDKEIGRVSEIKASMNDDSLVLSATYRNEKQEISGDILCMSIADRRVLHYLYYCTKLFLVRNYKKRNWGSGNVIEIVLKSVKVPKFVTNLSMNRDRVTDLMKEFQKTSPIGKGNLSEVESTMNLLQEEIDATVYRCFSLSHPETSIIEGFIAENASDISRTN
ncbi:MAG: Eco57I restriction-modification methylase domain-containing protein [Nitrososphaerales archaeon]